ALIPRSPSAAAAATWALGWLARPRRTRPPSTALRHPNEQRIQETPSWKPSGGELTRLLPFVGDTTTDGEAVRWLCDIVTEALQHDSIPALLVALTHPYSRARVSAAEALGRFGDASALP